MSKSDPVAEAYGTTDEAVAAMGLARSLSADDRMAEEILALQRELFVAGADLATNPASGEAAAGRLPRHRRDDRAPRGAHRRAGRRTTSSETFIVPGASPASAALDLARGTIRRAERAVVQLEARIET